jgi:hypothetical protein
LRVRPEAMVRPQLRSGAESRRAGTHQQEVDRDGSW